MKRRWTQWMIAGILLVFGIATILYQWIDLRPSQIRDYLVAFGWLAPFVFIVIYTVRPLILFPASILSVAGGLAFGTLPGLLYTLIGATLSGLVAYAVARRFGDRFLGYIASDDATTIRDKIEEDGFFYVLILRLVPLLNFDLVSYLSGLAKVKLSPFILATIVGMLPGAFVNNFLGNSLASGDITLILIALGAVVVLILVATVFREPIKRRLYNPKK